MIRQSIEGKCCGAAVIGRGVEVPMLVILIGAIGGAITRRLVGLFEGTVILALGYELFTAWMAPDEVEEQLTESESQDSWV